MKNESKSQKIKRLMLDWEPVKIRLSKRHRMERERLNVLVATGKRLLEIADGNLREKTYRYIEAATNSNEEFIIHQNVMLCGQKFHAMRRGEKGRPEILVHIREIEPRHREMPRRDVYVWINTKHMEIIE